MIELCKTRGNFFQANILREILRAGGVRRLTPTLSNSVEGGLCYVSDLLVDNCWQVSQSMSFELLGVFARRHRGHHELELAGGGGLQHQHHEHSLTGGAGSVLLPVETTPVAISLTLTEGQTIIKVISISISIPWTRETEAFLT